MKKIPAILFLLLFPLFVEAARVSLQLQWLHQFQSAGYYVAKEKGFYSDSGLEVEIREFAPGMKVVDEVLSGRADYGVGRSSLVIDRALGKPVVALGAVYQHSPLLLLTLASSGIDTPKKLAGKRVMMTNDAISSASILAMLSNQGVSKSALRFQEHTFRLDDLTGGKVDAMACYRSNEPYFLEKKGIPYNAISPADYGFDLYDDIFFTSEAKVTARPGEVRAFYEATLRGWKYAFDHIEETAQLIYDRYNTQNKSLESLIYEGRALKKLAYEGADYLGEMTKERIDRISSFYLVLGHFAKEPELEGFLYDIQKAKTTGIPNLTQEEREWLRKHPTLRLGIDNQWPPMEYVSDSGSYEGMAADYVRLVEKRLGVRFRIDPSLDWTQTVRAMEERKLDVYSCAVSTPERNTYMTFTHPYLSFPMVIVGNSPGYIDGLRRLEGKRVAVVDGYVSHELLKTNHPGIHLVPAKTVKEALEMVAYHKVDAYVGNLASASHYIRKEGFTQLYVVGELPYRYRLAMAARNDRPILGSILQKALDSITEEERNAIYNRWISIAYEHGFDYTLFWRTLGVLAVLAAAAAFWLFTLRREVGLRRKAQGELEALNKSLETQVMEKIAELREKDRVLLRQTKMAQMGEMIGVIAHQLKQPLTSLNLKGMLLEDAMEQREPDRKEIREFLDYMESQNGFMAQTIDDFRNFFNPYKRKERFHLCKAVDESVALLSGRLSKTRVEVLRSCITAEVNGLTSELKQVLITLLTNAIDAFEERNIQRRSIVISGKRDEETGLALLAVTDNAGGIPDEAMERIFEPFFSTKGKHGTGIGLYMARMILEESFQGSIAMENVITSEGSRHGSRFTIRIPLAKGTP